MESNSVALPTPTKQRWQPLRLGLVELYHYDVEEFWFRDGHLLLRGNNGTGKSKVLSLTLPFLLDGSLSSSRVEPDGDRTKRMEWNLLMNKRHERRIGYTWIEFGRREPSGAVFTVTLGCGLRAVAGRATVDTWFFVTDQRITQDLWLTTPERTALSRDRLIAAIGTRGQVFDTAQAYRRAVDERLFRLGADRYAALVDTLIQLRQPQLSKNPNEKRLSDALTESLPPLNQTALEDVAEAMGELDDITRRLEQIEDMRKAVAAFGGRYRRYAQMATRKRARLLRQAQTEFDNASRELNTAERELERARAAVTQSQADVETFEENLTSDNARLEVLRADPVMREAVRIEDARAFAEKCRQNAAEAQRRVTVASEALTREAAALVRRQQQFDSTQSRLLAADEGARRLASETGVARDHAGALKPVSDANLLPGRTSDISDAEGVRPDAGPAPGIADLSTRLPSPKEGAALIGRMREQMRSGETRRREQIALVRKRLREVDAAEQLCARARDARSDRADAFDAATEAARRSEEQRRTAAEGLLSDWRRYGTALAVLKLPAFDESIADLEDWLETLEGPNSVRIALDGAWQTQEQVAAVREADVRAQRTQLVSEQTALNEERARLESGQDRPPPAPYTRNAESRAGRDGAPLWQLVDFASHVPADARAGLEASLEASGLLDAWVSPEGALLDRRTQDTLLLPRPAAIVPGSAGTARGVSLAEHLVATLPAAGAAAKVQPHVVQSILESIACSEIDTGESEAWVSPTGEFRVANLRGAWSKSRAEYVGHAAREAARHARLGEISGLLASIDAGLAACEEALSAVASTRQRARDEYEAAPSEEGLRNASAEQRAAERQRREAQERLGEADAKLSQAEMARERARDSLFFDTRELQLPSTAPQIEALEQELNAYRASVNELAESIHAHQSAHAELIEARDRESVARETFGTSRDDHREKALQQRAADEKVETLQASVGKQVDELLQQIELADAERRRHDRALKDARAKLVVVSGERSAAHQKTEDLRERLDERTQQRQRAIEGLQAFTNDTGLLAVALPDVQFPDTSAPWGVEAALILARRAEQALVDIEAGDAQWERIQREISTDFNVLQSAMSTQGHSATIESSDYGMSVRIVYQQRSERPDTLERQLETELHEQRLILSAQERAVLENHLEKEIAANLQRMMSETEERVRAINVELEKRPTSTGVRYRLEWQVLPEDAEGAVAGLAEARKRLLRKSPDAWSADERRQLGEFLQARIVSERERENQGTLSESLGRALDYRRWHRFVIERKQDGQWRPLSGPASSGERALGLTVPLFAAASSHYESADERAPRLVLLDEAFAGIDDEARANCMGLIAKFDLDFVMTSEREWGCYAELPGINICQLVRREGMDTVFVSRWTWDGQSRRQEPEALRRFPEAELADS